MLSIGQVSMYCGCRPFLMMLLVMLTGCGAASLEGLETPGFRRETLTESGLPIQTLVPVGRSGSSDVLRIYIEGDGRAWTTPAQPSLDPTPHSDWFVRLALADPSKAAYLGWPCQYVHNTACTSRLWTDERFGELVLDAMNGAVEYLKQEVGARQVELVGFSGGGAIALLLAQRRTDVVQVQTLGGNIDPNAWVDFHHLQPLTGSLDVLMHPLDMRALPQRHLVGRYDRIMPPVLARGYVDKVKGPCIEVVEVDAGHARGWEPVWTQYRDRPIPCR